MGAAERGGMISFEISEYGGWFLWQGFKTNIYRPPKTLANQIRPFRIQTHQEKAKNNQNLNGKRPKGAAD